MTLNRRAFLNACRYAGIASPLLPGILLTLAAQAQEAAPDTKATALPKITQEMLDQAAELAGVGPFTAEQKKMMLDGLNDQRDAYAQIRALKLTNDVPPAYVFHPGLAAPAPPPAVVDPSHRAMTDGQATCVFDVPMGPARPEELAFATVGELSLRLVTNKDHFARANADVYRAAETL